jgi:hypothetical protein
MLLWRRGASQRRAASSHSRRFRERPMGMSRTATVGRSATSSKICWVVSTLNSMRFNLAVLLADTHLSRLHPSRPRSVTGPYSIHAATHLLTSGNINLSTADPRSVTRATESSYTILPFRSHLLSSMDATHCRA